MVVCVLIGVWFVNVCSPVNAHVTVSSFVVVGVVILVCNFVTVSCCSEAVYTPLLT